MDRLSLFKFMLGLALSGLFIVAFASTKDIFAKSFVPAIPDELVKEKKDVTSH